MGDLIRWLSANPDVLGIAAFVILSVVARYMPRNSPFWSAVRSVVTDYAQKNLTTVPDSVSVHLAQRAGGDGATSEFDVVLCVGDRDKGHAREVKRFTFPIDAVKANLAVTSEAAAIRAYVDAAPDALKGSAKVKP